MYISVATITSVTLRTRPSGPRPGAGEASGEGCCFGFVLSQRRRPAEVPTQLPEGPDAGVVQLMLL